VLVDQWFAENTYHSKEFAVIPDMIKSKEEHGLSISLALPTLNEEKTIGPILEVCVRDLMERYPLLDEVIVMDSNSSDNTRKIVESFGIPVYIHQEVLPQYGARPGKGEALWKSLYMTSGDIVIWTDTDIHDYHPRFVLGLLGPLLLRKALGFVKGFYRRPLKTRAGGLERGKGGRVTELSARPLFNLFYPELTGIIQPLAGEYGGRREVLEQLTFTSGYGVETCMLIEVVKKFGLPSIAQVDMLERIHNNQALYDLSKMSFAILQTVISRIEKEHGTKILEDINRTMKLIKTHADEYTLQVEEVAERERPPIITLPEYREKHDRPNQLTPFLSAASSSRILDAV
jgi:glucosyl-3-phosphoglycerate synthase